MGAKTAKRDARLQRRLDTILTNLQRQRFDRAARAFRHTPERDRDALNALLGDATTQHLQLLVREERERERERRAARTIERAERILTNLARRRIDRAHQSFDSIPQRDRAALHEHLGETAVRELTAYGAAIARERLERAQAELAESRERAQLILEAGTLNALFGPPPARRAAPPPDPTPATREARPDSESITTAPDPAYAAAASAWLQTEVDAWLTPEQQQRCRALRKDSLYASATQEALGCTRAELDRWDADGRLPHAFTRILSIHGKNVRARKWLRETIERARAHVPDWRERDHHNRARDRAERRAQRIREHTNAIREHLKRNDTRNALTALHQAPERDHAAIHALLEPATVQHLQRAHLEQQARTHAARAHAAKAYAERILNSIAHDQHDLARALYASLTHHARTALHQHLGDTVKQQLTAPRRRRQ